MEKRGHETFSGAERRVYQQHRKRRESAVHGHVLLHLRLSGGHAGGVFLDGACRPHAAEAAEPESAAAHRPPAGTSGASGAGDEIKTQDQAGPAFYNFE